MSLALPIIFVSTTHMGADELRATEQQVPTLTYNAQEAEVIVSKVKLKKRALWDLNRLGIVTEEVTPSSTFPEPEMQTRSPGARLSPIPPPVTGDPAAAVKTVKVVKLAWLTACLKEGRAVRYGDHLVYEGLKTSRPIVKSPSQPAGAEVVESAPVDASVTRPTTHAAKRKRDDRLVRPSLLHETTSEHDVNQHLPTIPDYLHTLYSCQRPTPLHPPNEAFIHELERIKLVRTLMADEVGVRAYSSATATLAAYPHTLLTAMDVGRLPGCGQKIALLFDEFKCTGTLQEARDEEQDAGLQTIKTFYNIWGVGAKTARDFCNKGWQDLDDVVEKGWDSLTRVQQIGLKYYDDFLSGIPRLEVETIADTILAHANKARPGCQMVIVGGYRRGKEMCGDVDVVISHPDEEATKYLANDILDSLEEAAYIPHTLTLSNKNTERGQETVEWKGKHAAGSGFDTLDKALVVWRDPARKTGEEKTNLHRRVDIITSPWKTAGCAVLGWSGATTFERDLRRYCKKERALKFDSSGIRSRTDGSWVDLETGPDGQPAPDMLTAERRVFEGLGLEYRLPTERCTG